MNPDFWNDSSSAQQVMKELNRHKEIVGRFDQLESEAEDMEVLYEFLQEGEGSEEEIDARYAEVLKQINEIEFRATLNKEEDGLDCILEINAGAGGTEACDWADMLLRMYTMWAEHQQGFKVRTLNRQDGDVAGIKSVTLEISGDYAYGLLKGENGVHRLVRVSPFNAQGKRMTSFASVFVHPLIDDTIEVEINPADLSWDTFRASGAGGQHVNKTESAVRVTHAPTGIIVECQEERSQHMNRDKALQMLKSRIYELKLREQLAEKEKIEDSKQANEWGSQIRSYVMDDRRVKDHRTGEQTSQVEKVMDGEIDAFLQAWLLFNPEAN